MERDINQVLETELCFIMNHIAMAITLFDFKLKGFSKQQKEDLRMVFKEKIDETLEAVWGNETETTNNKKES